MVCGQMVLQLDRLKEIGIQKHTFPHPVTLHRAVSPSQTALAKRNSPSHYPVGSLGRERHAMRQGLVAVAVPKHLQFLDWARQSARNKRRGTKCKQQRE